jgi:pilus assembly protein Flp/PilA
LQSSGISVREPALGIGAVIKHRHFRKNQTGAAAAEYALVLAILGAALTFGALALGTAITDSIDTGDCTAGTVSANVDCR